jgi:hypothetical protein
MQIPLSNSDITELEIKYVTEVLRTPRLSLGPKLAEFEQKMAHFVGRKYAIVVNSDTAGLHLVTMSPSQKGGQVQYHIHPYLGIGSGVAPGGLRAWRLTFCAKCLNSLSLNSGDATTG